MKYILIIIICAGAYYKYINQESPQIPASDLTYIELLERIKTEDVKASVLVNAAYKSAADGCDNVEWLKMRGVNTQMCDDKLKAFKDMCAQRIFPDLDKVINGYRSADKLLKRYSKCTSV